VKYQKPSFTLPATEGTSELCKQQHAMTDRRGLCIRCGERLAPPKLQQAIDQLRAENAS
jgi:hypothetical protein